MRLNKKQIGQVNTLASYYKDPLQALLILAKAVKDDNPVLTKDGHLDKGFLEKERNGFKARDYKQIAVKFLTEKLQLEVDQPDYKHEDGVSCAECAGRVGAVVCRNPNCTHRNESRLEAFQGIQNRENGTHEDPVSVQPKTLSIAV